MDKKTETKTEKEEKPDEILAKEIMEEMGLKGGTKKRLVKTLIKQYGMDKQKVLFKLKRALITERYMASH
ncbi:MAG TPA: hypothetical protein EYP22_08370 [Methanosarcinales archaeon]|nr:hypothetical protein [Methanosarcinales archaeon]